MKYIRTYQLFNESIVNEKMGVPDNIHPYAAAITDKLMDMFSTMDISALLEDKTKDVVLDKDDLKDVMSDSFPLTKINLSLAFNVTHSNNTIYIEGTQGGMKKVGNEYECNISASVNINLEIFLKYFGSKRVTDRVRKEINAVMYHELTHAYEDVMRRESPSKRKTSILQTEDKVYDAISVKWMKSGNLPRPIATLLSLIYVQASYEINARVPQVYSLIKNVEDPKERVRIIKDSEPWTESQMLVSYNAQKVYDSMIDDIQSEEIPGDPVQLLSNIFTAINANFISGNNHIMEIVLDDENLNDADKTKLEHIMGAHAQDIEKLSKKSVLDFMKYWEKRFHVRGEKLRRKLLRLATY